MRPVSKFLFTACALLLFGAVHGTAGGQALSVDITFTNNNQCSGTPVSFTSTVTGGSEPYTWQWNFGAGSSTAQHPSYIFESYGCGTHAFR